MEKPTQAMIEIPAITLWQPYASLLACLAKLYETRGWTTNYRGPIAIHAAKKDFDTDVFLDRELYPFAEDLNLPDIYSFDKLPKGCVIATAELIGCWRIANRVDGGVYAQESITGQRKHIVTLGNEGLFGDFTPGRYAWEFTNMTMLPEPIPAKGMQGLWKWKTNKWPVVA